MVDDFFEKTVVFKGKVQGVGFRLTVARFANELGLKGTVCNLPNGDVKLIAQGSYETIKTLIDKIKLEYNKNIDEVEMSNSNIPNNFYDHFNIVT